MTAKHNLQRTDPQITPPPSTWITHYDAVVVGAGYGGLITGAILAKNGLKTVVVDDIDYIGGRCGSSFYHGYWLDWGNRGGNDFGDNYVCHGESAQYGKKAAEAAGAEITWAGPTKPDAVMHGMSDGTTYLVNTGEADINLFCTNSLHLSPDQIDRFLPLLGKVLSEDPHKLMTVTFKEYLPTLVEDEGLRKAFLEWAAISMSFPTEETSVGRFIMCMQNRTLVYKADDPEVGGTQGFMEAYARAIRKYGGEIKLGLETMDIPVEGNRVNGIVVRDKAMMVQEFRAPVVVFTYPLWEVLKVLDESYFPPQIVENAKRLERGHRGDLMCLNIGLSQLPTIRATGQADTNNCFNQFYDVEGVFGFSIPTLLSKKQAPPGKHLLSIICATGGPGSGSGYEPFKSFKDGKARLDRIHEYLRKYYSDLDKITEWIGYQWPKVMATAQNFTAVHRSPLQVKGLDGLYFAGSTVEVDGTFEDVEANSALQATSLILQRKGK